VGDLIHRIPLLSRRARGRAALGALGARAGPRTAATIAESLATCDTGTVPVPLRAGLLTATGSVPEANDRRSLYQEHGPAAGTSVLCTWEGRSDWRRSLRLLPDGCVDLVWDGSRLVVIGASIGPVRHFVQAEAQHVGLRLRPGMAGHILGCPPAQLPSEGIALDSIWGTRARPFERKLAHARTPAAARCALERLVNAHAQSCRRPDPVVLEATRQLATYETSIDQVARHVAVSGRDLRRRFDRDVGLGPKALQRVFRLRRFVRRLDELTSGLVTLATVAADAGYADQAHLSRECRVMTGSSPRELMAQWAGLKLGLHCVERAGTESLQIVRSTRPASSREAGVHRSRERPTGAD
jgi:AraC-like DNA-binding protein